MSRHLLMAILVVVGMLGGQAVRQGHVNPVVRTVMLRQFLGTVVVDEHLGQAFIATSVGQGGAGSIMALDTRMGARIRTIAVRQVPWALAVDARTDTVFGATRNGVLAINPRAGTVAHVITLPALTNPVLGVDEQANRLVVAGSVPDTRPYASPRSVVDVLDAQSGTLLHGSMLRGRATAIAVDARTDRAFVVQDDSVAVVSMTNGQIIRHVPVGRGPRAMAVDIATGRVFVIDDGTASVRVLDARTGALIGTVPVGVEPWALAVDERTNHVFVVNQAVRGTVSMLDAISGRLLRTIEVGVNPVAVATEARSGRVFVANGGVLHSSANINPTGSVTELDAMSGTPLRTIPLSNSFLPRIVAIDEQAGRALVVSDVLGVSGSSAVTLLDATR